MQNLVSECLKTQTSTEDKTHALCLFKIKAVVILADSVGPKIDPAAVFPGFSVPNNLLLFGSSWEPNPFILGNNALNSSVLGV